jgi:hypothetical protein
VCSEGCLVKALPFTQGKKNSKIRNWVSTLGLEGTPYYRKQIVCGSTSEALRSPAQNGGIAHGTDMQELRVFRASQHSHGHVFVGGLYES